MHEGKGKRADSRIKEKAVARLKNGESSIVVAKDYGVTQQTVNVWRRAAEAKLNVDVAQQATPNSKSKEESRDPVRTLINDFVEELQKLMVRRITAKLLNME